MTNQKVCHELKKLRKQKGYSLEKIAEIAMVSKQGYHFWEQGLRMWKLEVLTQLSSVLGYEILIKDGELKIIESDKEKEEILEKEEVNTMDKTIKLGSYQIITMYTGACNINFDEKNILDKCLVYKDKKEAEYIFENETLVPLYALYDKENDYVYEQTIDTDVARAYSMYYWNYSHPIEENPNIVYVDETRRIMVVKKYAILDLENRNENGTYPVLAIVDEEVERSLGVFIVTDLAGNELPVFKDDVSTVFSVSVLN